MKKVLIVTNCYQPALLADMHRARMLAWDLPEFGWDAEILAPAAEEVRADAVEPGSEIFFHPGTPSHAVHATHRWLFRVLGMTTHGWKTWLPMRDAGDRLLATGRFDLVYFSTTTFLYFTLGARWRRKFGVPYVLDFHDPWVKEPGAATRRKTSFKRSVLDGLARRMERTAVADADGLVAVSPRYIENLKTRYRAAAPRWLQDGRTAVIPFAASARDLSAASSARTPDAGDGIRLCYVGAGGEIMQRGFHLLCEALSGLRQTNPALVNRVRVHLHGTSVAWRSGDPRVLQQTAVACGVADLVDEQPERVCYHRALELLMESDGALVLGVNEAGYTPSKLFTYALSGKPLLATLHRGSPAVAWFASSPEGASALVFDADGADSIKSMLPVVERFLQNAESKRIFDRTAALAPYSSHAMAGKHADLFNKCVAHKNAVNLS
jgi:hypothetical protein